MTRRSNGPEHFTRFAARLADERSELFPGSTPCRDGTPCPRHGVERGRVTGMCLACHTEAWEWTGEKYLEAERAKAA